MRGVFPVCAHRASTPRLRIGKCPTVFFVYIGFVIGRKPSFVIKWKESKRYARFLLKAIV